MVESASGRWDTYALTYVAIADSDKAASADLLALVLPATRRRCRSRSATVTCCGFALTVRRLREGRTTAVGTVLYVPRGASNRWLDVTLKITQKGGVPKATLVGVKRGTRK